MQTLNNVHQQFAEFFKSETLRPFAFLVSKKLSEGHICIDVNNAAMELQGSALYDLGLLPAKAARLNEEHFVTVKNGAKQPFVLHNNRLYLQRYFNYETSILTRIKKFVESEREHVDRRMEELITYADYIQSLFSNTGTLQNSTVGEHTDWQLVAAVAAVLNNFTIITGGPGTGKTTTVAKILAILYSIYPDLRVVLAAPTGKAAVRLAEALKASAINGDNSRNEKFKSLAPMTIHRLLQYIPDSPYFKHDQNNPVNFDVVIVDESSMIDAALFAKLLDAIGPETKLILLGDKDQLASVEAGSLFGDLCKTQTTTVFHSAKKIEFINSFITDHTRQLPAHYISPNTAHILSEHIIELKKSHRFISDSGIGKFSRAIIKNDLQTLHAYFNKNSDEQVVIDTEYNPVIFEQFVKGYTDYIREPDIKKALQKLNQLRVLCAVREGEQGLYSVNRAIENYLIKNKLINKNAEYYENRPIIITKNYYALGLFNGDVGIIRTDKNGVLKAWFEDSNQELKSVFPGYIAASETVFAMTIHKSQGSEYDRVLVVLPNNVNIELLTRELLYTAVTRARSKVTVQGSEAVILHTAQGFVERASGIMDRFDE